MKKSPVWFTVLLTLNLLLALGGSAIQAENQDLNAWLSYTIEPRNLTRGPDISHHRPQRSVMHPAMWGNGQLELMAEVERPCISEVMCFGFGVEALWYGPSGAAGEEHLLPAVYDARTGKKYFLYSIPPAKVQRSKVTFRPDRQVWHYEFDDLTIDVSLIPPRLKPGYLLKLELSPSAQNKSRKWFVYHEVRAFHGNIMFASEAEYDLRGGRVWFKSSREEHGEAIGSTADAEAINLGKDGRYATDIMVKLAVEKKGDTGPVTVYFARAFGDTVPSAQKTLEQLLSSPAKLEKEAEAWWNKYLNEVPRLEVPDETFSKTFLWSWPNHRMNRIDVPIGRAPAGLCPANNTRLKRGVVVSGDNLLHEAIQVLYDPQPAAKSLVFHLRETRKSGLLGSVTDPTQLTTTGRPGSYVSTLGRFCGLLHRYLLNTGDLTLVEEDIGGKTVLQRLEDAAEAILPFRDEPTRLYPTDDEITRFPEWEGKPFGLGPMHEAVTRYRGGAGTFYSDSNAVIFGAFRALSEIEELVGNEERSARYRQLAVEVRQAIQKHLWNDEIGFFVDLRPDRSMSDYVGIGGFITGLFANSAHRPGGVATAAQAAKLAEWCNHPDFVSELGVISLARSSPYYEPMSYKGRNSAFNFSPTNQIPAGLYAHGCYEEAHRQMFKQFRRLGENAGLGPRYRGEAYAETGEILPWRFQNYPTNLPLLGSVIEGVFGMRWTNEALKVQVNSPWPWAKLTNLRIRGSVMDLELTANGDLIAKINGNEVARSAERRLELPWDIFTRPPA